MNLNKLDHLFLKTYDLIRDNKGNEINLYDELLTILKCRFDNKVLIYENTKNVFSLM